MNDIEALIERLISSLKTHSTIDGIVLATTDVKETIYSLRQLSEERLALREALEPFSNALDPLTVYAEIDPKKRILYGATEDVPYEASRITFAHLLNARAKLKGKYDEG